MKRGLSILLVTCVAIVGGAFSDLRAGGPEQAASAGSSAQPHRALLDRYCVTCHNERLKTAGLTLDTMELASVGAGADVWEKVIRKLRAGSMPPPGRPRPDSSGSTAFVSYLETELDRAATANPDPGRTETFHRLNRSGVSERGSRSPRRRRRRVRAPSGRRCRRARLRQHGGRPVGLAGPAGAVHVDSAEDQPSRGRDRPGRADRGDLSHPAPAVSGRPPERRPELSGRAAASRFGIGSLLTASTRSSSVSSAPTPTTSAVSARRSTSTSAWMARSSSGSPSGVRLRPTRRRRRQVSQGTRRCSGIPTGKSTCSRRTTIWR